MTIVETRPGRVEGSELSGLLVFKGIPFARPPVGALRWRVPEPPAPWTGIRPTNTFGAHSWQPPLPDLLISTLLSASRPYDEDCLTLNVWTPRADNRGRPVIVWIHGGAFFLGSGAQSIYDGTTLAKRGDVVVVTINYRLGALGFLRLTEVTEGRIPSTGNEGLLDQIRALEWVRDNIERFGGDPANVTIFGESAGGMSVGALLGAPRARGLFKRAIAQSGAASTVISSSRAAESAERFVSLMWPATSVAALQSADPFDITAAAALQFMENDMTYQPCIDGELLPQLPLDAVRAGNADDVSVMVGATSNEWNLFLAMDPEAMLLDVDGLLERVSARVGSSAGAMIDRYAELLASRGEPIDATSLYAAIETDRAFRLPALRLAEALAARAQRAYHYEFAWRSPLLDGVLKACHAVDIAFVFGTHADDDFASQFWGRGPSADALARTVQDAWLSFARNGTPRAPGLDRWEPYDPKRPTTAVFDAPASVVDALLARERALWDSQPDGTVVGRL